ncbi:MAG: tetratricopeptide repeat protein [Aphanocapsa sp. GSE-SYN-MK-11-07L]|jgi:tetratricopeptide (TPR) repeat protein|nr:tetratricopeptide repeat protein [Aphanocapsa sp. GSE-SYN-MK-11-07L]
MDAETLLDWVNALVLSKTGSRLSYLQQTILQQVWLGHKYQQIALETGYTEGHIKDAAAHLWQTLSSYLGEKVNKQNCRLVLEQHSQVGLTSPAALRRPDHSPLIGREQAIADLDQLVQQGSKVIVIQAAGGVGKTSLAQHYFQAKGFAVVLELLMAKETQNIISVESVVEEWLQQYFQQEPGREFGVTLGRLKRHLQNQQVGVLIDNLEPGLDPQGRLIAPHRLYLELLRVLADWQGKSVTLMTSRDRLCEPDLTVEHYRLPGLALSAWQQFFGDRQIDLDPALVEMHQAYGGNAKAMGILAGMIQADFAGSIAAYWQTHQTDLLATTDLKNLVASQVNRLQNLDPQAYRLFCRLGCYRYQDVARIPAAGLICLLWDLPPAQHWQVITSLQNRSLIEHQQGGYWLHPVIQAEAVVRLRGSPDWALANQKAAEFWTDQIQTITTLPDALQALEAYYHYAAIPDFELAGKVILKSRLNQWQQFLPLGSTLYRMGLLQPVRQAISQVLAQHPAAPDLIELHNILGDLDWISGQIQPALAFQQQTIDLATQTLATLPEAERSKHKTYYLKMLEVDSRLSMGLYLIDLWELDLAAERFQQVIDQATDTSHHRWAEKAAICLGLVHSYLGLTASAQALAAQADQNLQQQITVTAQPGSFAYFIQILGQTHVNLGNLQRGQDLYQQAIAFAETSHYPQVKARILNGLAEIYRCRHQFSEAVDYHQQAIALLEQIGAKCDLAEAHFQLGLTWQQYNQPQTSQQHFQTAIALFTAISAPRQVAKVTSHQ